MLRLAILSARGRLGTFAGALIALFASAVLVMAGAMMLESALRARSSATPPPRLWWLGSRSSAPTTTCRWVNEPA
jgi:hypothetical protein